MTISRRSLVKSLLSVGLFGAFHTKASNADLSGLPRVFIIGDSISIGYTPFVTKALDGKAVVSRPKQNCNGTKMGIQKLDEWLGNEKYDLIHFNFGLHDMKHVDPVTGDGSNKGSDPVQSDLATYKNNLESIVRRLKATDATVVFATSTPVVGKSDRGVLREPEQLTKYNKTAVRVMRKAHVAVNDLFGFSLPLVKQYQIPNDVHFTEPGYELLGKRVAEFIATTLRISMD